MSCIRSLWINNPMLRSVGVRSFASAVGGGENPSDGKKAKPISSLMSALEGLKVDGTLSKQKIGFSAAAEFKKRKLQRIAKANVEKESLNTKESQDDEKIQQAAQDVAKVFPDQKRTQLELLEQLMKVKSAQEDPDKINDVLSGIKVQKEGLSQPLDSTDGDHGHGERGSHISFDTTFSGIKTSGEAMGSSDKIGQKPVKPSLQQRKSVHQRLNVFKPVQDIPRGDVESTSEQRPSIWDVEADRERKELLAEMTRNGFEEMIKLTEEGKLWTYPIDNEKGLEEEQKVPFYEHVFLEEHLEGFPDIPEVMSFMELVLIGLSKNPYLTVEQKKEHIEWFRNYFENKMEVLKETTSATS